MKARWSWTARAVAHVSFPAALMALAAYTVAAQGAQVDSTAMVRHESRLVVGQAVGQERPHAVSHSDLYYTRLTIHRVGSYAMLPLFAGEYILGSKLLADANAGARSSDGIRSAHATVAAGLGVLFGVNTATGLWNLWDSRRESQGAARKYVHAAFLIAADAGMMWAAGSADDARERAGGPQHHRNIAVGAIGLATVGTVMMWLWK